jgi:hypothetical protein
MSYKGTIEIYPLNCLFESCFTYLCIPLGGSRVGGRLLIIPQAGRKF